MILLTSFCKFRKKWIVWVPKSRIYPNVPVIAIFQRSTNELYIYLIWSWWKLGQFFSLLHSLSHFETWFGTMGRWSITWVSFWMEWQLAGLILGHWSESLCISQVYCSDLPSTLDCQQSNINHPNTNQQNNDTQHKLVMITNYKLNLMSCGHGLIRTVHMFIWQHAGLPPTPSSNNNKRNFLLLFVRMQEELCLCQNEVAFGSFHPAGLSQAYGCFLCCSSLKIYSKN